MLKSVRRPNARLKMGAERSVLALLTLSSIWMVSVTPTVGCPSVRKKTMDWTACRGILVSGLAETVSLLLTPHFRLANI